MIRVALHVIAGSRGGPRTYGVALAEALGRRDDVDLVVLTDRPDAFPGLVTVQLKGPRPWADHVQIPRLLKRLSPDVYHNTKNALPIARPVPTVVTIHDLAYHHFPETFGTLSRLYLRWHHIHCARHADCIITPSYHARRDLQETLHVAEERIHVVHHGVAEPFFDPPARGALQLAQPYVLSVGTLQARKNLDILVRAVAKLREERGTDVTLAIAGRRGWKTAAFDAACEQTPVRLLGMVADEELPGLYANAAVFVQPSSYEGFGLTAAEAMACGTPVIAADAGSLPEVVGDAGLLVPPRDVDALAGAIAQVLEHRALRRELSESGRMRAMEFRWDRSAEQHIEVYRIAAGKGHRHEALA